MNEREQASRVMAVGFPDPESVLRGRCECEGCMRVEEFPLTDRGSFTEVAAKRGWVRLPGERFRFLCPRCAKVKRDDARA